MVEARTIALAYAEHGFRVLPIYPLTRNDEDELICTCSNGAACVSPGKHGLSQYAPHGALSATDDPAVINTWPEDAYNIGFATSALLPVIDIDDTAVANALLQPDVGLADQAIVARTGKGIHIYLRTTEPTRACTLKTTDGRTIGDLRADRLFVVAPPSWHKSGKQYKWIGKSVLSAELPVYEGTGHAYATELLKEVGIDLRPPPDQVDVAALEGGIVAAPLPFEIPADNVFLNQMMTGTYPTDDRSGTIFRFCCECFRVAYRLGIPLDERQVAAAAKYVDERMIHAKGSKYAQRGLGGDILLWDCAVKAQRAVQIEIDQEQATLGMLPQTAVAVAGSDPPPTSTSTYLWNEQTGFITVAGRSPKRICNFEPVIEEELEVWDGDEHTRDDWLVRMGTYQIRLRPENREDLRAFQRVVNRALPTDHIVEDRMWGPLWDGMRWYSMGRVAHRRAYVAPGWLPDRDAFLFPGAPGAITANGIDTSITFEADDAPARMMQFGYRVQPIEDPDFLQSALEQIYSITAPQVIVPLMTQLLASTLASLGAAQSATIIHLMGRTGSYKTSILRACMSIYGRFVNEQRDAIDSWSGTKNSLQATFHRMRDLPVFLDDYKATMFTRNDTTAINMLVQNAADRTARTRMGRDQREQAYLVARGLGVSTGEDLWEGQESTSARTIAIEINRNTVDLDALRRVQVLASAGTLQSIGYEWVSWLCGQGKEQLKGQIELERAAKYEVARRTPLAEKHPRVLAAITNLLAVDTVFKAFLHERAPGFSEQYDRIQREGWHTTVVEAADRASEAEYSSPFQALRTAILDGIATGKARLQSRTEKGLSYGVSGADIVGYVDEKYVWFSQGITLGWYFRQMAEQRLNPTVTWKSFTQQARQAHHGFTPSSPIRVYGSTTPIRLFRLPLEEIIKPDTQPETVETIQVEN